MAAKSWIEASYHGTLNLCIGNRNGVIVATDSRATGARGREIVSIEDDHQKLFRINEQTVVGIAGYNRVDVPWAQEFDVPVVSVILAYIDQIKKQGHTPTYQEIVGKLTHLMTARLTALSNIQLATEKGLDPGRYDFQMIVVGRSDKDVKATKVFLRLKAERGPDGRPFLEAVVLESHESTIGLN